MGASLRLIGLAASLLAAPTAAQATADARVLVGLRAVDTDFSPGSDFVSAEAAGAVVFGAGSCNFVSSAFANPRRGSIGAGTTVGCVGAHNPSQTVTQTFSQFDGSLLFSISGLVVLKLAVIGSLTGGDFGSSFVRAELSTLLDRFNRTFGDVSCCDTNGQTFMRVDGRIISRSAFNNQFEVERSIFVEANVPVFLQARLETTATARSPNGRASLLYGNTAQIQIITPAGMTFRSLDGDFLSDLPPVSPVPEPASWAMMIAGFGLVAGKLRLRHRQSAVLG